MTKKKIKYKYKDRNKLEEYRSLIISKYDLWQPKTLKEVKSFAKKSQKFVDVEKTWKRIKKREVQILTGKYERSYQQQYKRNYISMLQKSGADISEHTINRIKHIPINKVDEFSRLTKGDFEVAKSSPYYKNKYVYDDETRDELFDDDEISFTLDQLYK